MDVLQRRTFCICGHFVGWTFCRLDVLQRKMFCRGGRFVEEDVLYPWTFCIYGCFVERTFCRKDVLQRRTLCGRTYCGRTYHGKTFCGRTFCTSTENYQMLNITECRILKNRRKFGGETHLKVLSRRLWLDRSTALYEGCPDDFRKIAI